MPNLVIFVLDDVERFPEVLRGWQRAGVRGITILESTGLARQQQVFERDDIPLMPSLRNMLVGRERHHRTLFAIVEEENVVDEVIKVTQDIVGDLREPNTGILFVTPVTRVLGLQKRSKR